MVMALGVPVTLAMAIIVPALWVIGAGWVAGLAGLMAVDALLATPRDAMEAEIDAPLSAHVGEDKEFRAIVSLGNATRPRQPEFRLTTNDRLDVSPRTCATSANQGGVLGWFNLRAHLRGDAQINRLWTRWKGPFGLIWRQRVDDLDLQFPVTADTKMVRDTAAELFTRDANLGAKLQKLRGEGTEFDGLTEFLPGMDKRAIDWKHSARHAQLLVREFRTERNHNIIFAFDSGYLMCEDMVGAELERGDVQITKLDRAINAALLMGFVSLKIGDRVGLYAFDRKPYLYAPAVGGTRHFAQLQRLSSQIDYSEEETNFTLGLTQLAQNLQRRTLIVVYTDFVDSTQAELMVENMARLLKRHVVVFVAFRNTALDRLRRQDPSSPEETAQSVVAESLMRERALVLERLRRMGVNVIDARAETLNMSVLNTYLNLKARNVL